MVNWWWLKSIIINNSENVAIIDEMRPTVYYYPA